MVLEGVSGRTYVGRYHEQTDKGLLLHDVGVHDPAGGMTREEYLERTNKFGVRADHKQLVVPHDEVAGLVRLNELGG